MSKKDHFAPKPGTPIDLNDYDPDFHEDYDKSSGREAVDRLQEQIQDWQERLYAEGKQSLLIVFQAMDTGGKDGVIKKVFSGINPAGVYVKSFKAPTPEDLAHDFLWRVHPHVPGKGYIGIFNRSHYEDVLVVRVNNLVPKEVWQARYDHINAFERLLADSGTRILKFYLHISKDEQKERLQARLDNPDKHWKFSIGDLPVHERWNDYMDAYADAITRCNTEYAPWYIVPANHKWYRDLFVTRVICDTLEAMNPQYPPPEAGLDEVVIPD
ncbi:MAG: polyphosphate kinase 2 family protein [Chloroflexi bacterium]|nr:polyphosphate kinase 2 family protein [Chloroflexota bacterium]